jgi:hypothetical protein
MRLQVVTDFFAGALWVQEISRGKTRSIRELVVNAYRGVETFRKSPKKATPIGPVHAFPPDFFLACVRGKICKRKLPANRNKESCWDYFPHGAISHHVRLSMKSFG